MPTAVCHIVRDISRGDTTFFVRMYASVQDIGLKIPIDSFEAHVLVVDEPTLDYLNDLEIVKSFRERSKT